MLKSGNELKDFLKTQHLVFFRAKNELKTNSQRTQFCAQMTPVEPQNRRGEFMTPSWRCQAASTSSRA
jgi:hypothetical protein